MPGKVKTFINKQPWYIIGALLMLITVVLECTVFNIHAYDHLFDRAPVIAGLPMTADRAVETLDEITFLTEPSQLEITGINAAVQTIQLPLESRNSDGVYVRIAFRDGSTDVYAFSEPVWIAELSRGDTGANLVTLRPVGDCKSIAIAVDVAAGDTVALLNPTLNVPRAVRLNSGRMIAVFALLCLGVLLRPKSGGYAVLYDPAKKRQKLLIAGLLLVEGALLVFLYTTSVTGPFGVLYNEMTEALLAGRVDLGKTMPPVFAALDNPYDYLARTALNPGEHDLFSTWDRAYFNGQFYSYFGPLPMLLLYLPAKALFSYDLTSAQAVLIFSLALLPAAWLLLDRVARLWFPDKLPLPVFLMALFAFVNGSGFLWLLRRPAAYELANISALTMTTLGLALWLTALLKAKHPPAASNGGLMLGSLCMASVVWCRPSLLLFSFLAVPLLWRVFVRKPDRRWWGNAAAFALPFLLFAALAMAYNAARFGSVFEFGARYQITIWDVSNGLPAASGWAGLWYYYLQPPLVQAQFPFLFPVVTDIPYQGHIFVQESFGFLWSTAMILFALFGRAARPVLRDKPGALNFYRLAMASAFALSILTVIMGGVAQRYLTDYLFIYLLAAILVLFALYEHHRDDPAALRRLNGAAVAAFAGTMVYHLLLAMQGESGVFRANFPGIFHSIKRAVAFWL